MADKADEVEDRGDDFTPEADEPQEIVVDPSELEGIEGAEGAVEGEASDGADDEGGES